MSIPINITKDHIEKAILEIQQSVIPAERLSVTYFIKVGNENLPPKYVISIANKYANGIELGSKDFNAVEAKNFLKKLKFVIIEKNGAKSNGYFQQLNIFLDQAKTTNLRYKHFDNEYLGLKVRVGFGKGNLAHIPWITFLGDGQTTENGIYPVYLYYKEFNELILAYGISETKAPLLSWGIQIGSLSIRNYYKEKGKTPERYGDSFVYKTYNLENNLDPEQMDDDLAKLIDEYKKIISDNSTNKKNTVSSPVSVNKNPIMFQIFKTNFFIEEVLRVGLQYKKHAIGRYIFSLLTKPFVILTGLSGSGKTKLAQVFSQWICEDESQYKLIPVGADWTNREPLLGYSNALKNGNYVLPENGALELILDASKEENQNKPYFLILDEMNLSHVERYFADFLSAMESGKDIPLHPESAEWEDKVPSKIRLPKNLFIVGTVNIDETTYMFSPKVLDRANVIEFRVSENEMDDYLKNIKPLNIESINGLGANMAASFVEIANNRELKLVNIEDLNIALIYFFKELKRTGAEFGYRSASEIHRFVAVVNQLEPEWIIEEIIDCAIMQKLLPKVHGSRRKLEPVLKTLGALCLVEGKNIEEIFNGKSEVDFNDPTLVKYPISLEKIDRMYKGLIDNGFTSYAEA